MTARDNQPRNPNGQILAELGELLAQEGAALRALDVDAVARIAEAKLSLGARLSEITPFADEERAELSRLKELALANQILLVHARDTVRGLIATLAGRAPTGFGQPSPSSVRLDLRG